VEGNGAARFPQNIELFFKLYPAPPDTEAIRSATDFGGDSFIAYGTWKWIEIDRKTGDKKHLPATSSISPPRPANFIPFLCLSLRRQSSISSAPSIPVPAQPGGLKIVSSATR